MLVADPGSTVAFEIDIPLIVVAPVVVKALLAEDETKPSLFIDLTYTV